MRILLTNDDGIHAPGLAVLEEIAASAVGRRVDRGSGGGAVGGRPFAVPLPAGAGAQVMASGGISVAGTPTDAVMMALGQLVDGAAPDLLLSGVNRGANLGEDVTYSGTVAAAMEGALAGVRSIALSQVYARQGMGDQVPFGPASAWGERVIRPLIDVALPPRTLLNVNFPVGEPRGVRVVRQGFHDVGRTRIVENTDPRGYRYYWFALGGTKSTPDHATDLEAVADGFVAVTPLQLDLTHDAALGGLVGLFDEGG